MQKKFKIFNFLKFFFKKIFGLKIDNWKIGISNKNLYEFDLNNIKFLEPGFAEYWADPFYFKHQTKEYIFFEKYSHISGKGCISVGELKNLELVNVHDIIKKDYHLSYPFIYFEKNNFYLIPETHENKRLEVYKAVDFPYRWKLYSTAFDGKILADPTVLAVDNELWLFVNETKNDINNLNKDLNIYKIDNLLMNNYKPHLKNPVIQSFIGGRNAGKIEKINGKIIRPSQIYKENKYGFGLCISEIEILNDFEYKEKIVKKISPTEDSNIKGIHHISIGEGKLIIDCNLK